MHGAEYHQYWQKFGLGAGGENREVRAGALEGAAFVLEPEGGDRWDWRGVGKALLMKGTAWVKGKSCVEGMESSAGSLQSRAVD